MTNAKHIMRALDGSIWAIQPEKLDAIAQVVANRFTKHPKLTAEEIRAIQRPKPLGNRAGAVAVIPLFGVLAQRMDMMMAFSGGTSTEAFLKEFNALVKDDGISAIVINVDSPGGSVAGTQEVAEAVYNARGSKPIIAVANSLMCSAAYWIGSAADEVVANPAAFVGSVSAIMVRADVSEQDEKDGVRYEFVTGAPYKAEGNPHFPVTDDELEALQANVNAAHNMFIESVARNRGISVDDADARFGKGRALFGALAKDAGLVDRIATLDEVVAELQGGKSQARSGLRGTAAIPAMAATNIYIQSPTLNDAQLAAIGSVLRAGATTRTVKLTADDSAPEVCPECGAPMSDGECSKCGYKAETDVPPDDEGESDEEDKPNTKPAPEARSELMADNATTATGTPGVVPIIDPIAAERKRNAEISALRGTAGVTDQEINAWINAGTSYEAVAAEVLRKQKDAISAAPAVRAGASREHRQPFASFGEQLQAVAIAGGAGNLLPSVDASVAIGRLNEMQAAATGHSTGVGSDGGFLVGTQTEQGLMKRAYDNSVLASRCDVTPIGPNADGLESFQIKESSRATGSRYGGVRFYRAAEAETVTASKLGLERFEIRLEDLMAVTYLTERLLQDATALQSEVETAFGEEGAFVLDDEIFRGSGAGQCLGAVVSQNPALVTVSAEGSQVADTFVAENALKMYARVWSRSRANGVWVYNQALEPQFPQMVIKVKNVAGSENVGGFAAPIFTPAGFNGNEYATLYGRPAIPIEQCSAPGDVGDIAFLDLSQYKLINKGGLKVDESMHVRFLNNERAFRFVFRVNGKPKWSSALTPYKGADTLSPFVTLAAR